MRLLLNKPATLKFRALPYIKENAKIILQAIFTFFFIGIAIFFFEHEQAELRQVKSALFTADWRWMVAGIVLTGLLIIAQGLMYVASFASCGNKVSLIDATILFLKRNFVSVFLPAGAVSSLIFFSGDIEKKGISKSQIHFSSSVYWFVGILTVIIIAVPAFSFSLFSGHIGANEWIGSGFLLLLIITFFILYKSIINKGIVYNYVIKIFPSSKAFTDDLENNKIDRKSFLLAVFYSLIIEIIGIAHLYVAMVALHFNPSFTAAILGYTIAVIYMIISPFLKGMGAIELSLTYLLTRFGFSTAEAISVTILYRFYEFWLPLLASAVSFLVKVNKLLMRVIPSLLLLILGVINIISVLTPANAQRLDRLKDFLPVDDINVSNYFVLATGLFLLVTSAFMLKGLRMAWYFALVLCVISIIGNLTKAIDYEEAIVSFIVMVILLVSRDEYYVKHDARLRNIGIQTTLLSIAAVIVYGSIGFYFLNKKHFHVDFNWYQSIRYTLQNYFLIGSRDLVPRDAFAQAFLYSINISGLATFSFLIYTLVSPYIKKSESEIAEQEQAKLLLQQYGKSSLDYFKTYYDKIIYKPEGINAFLAYRISGNYAVVLENPVAESTEEMKQCIISFDQYCYDMGLKNFYFRVPDKSLALFKDAGKKCLVVGQEGIVDLTGFNLQGGANKSIRNALKKVSEMGFYARVYTPPVKDGVLQKIKLVSDQWMKDKGGTEIVFSQGMFIWEELKEQTLITVENAEEKIVAFLNIIPDFVSGEGTYDLIRKTSDAPGGVMDFIMVELFNYLKSQQYTSVNLGFAPLSGIDSPSNFPERSMKFAYEKIRSFSHYKGLREFKNKFSPVWHHNYLIYEDDYDLLQLPGVLARVTRP